MGPLIESAERLMRGSQEWTGFRCQKSGCAFVGLQRPARKQEAGTVGKLVQIVRPGLKLGHGADEERLLPAGNAEPRSDQIGKPLVICLPDVMAIQILELLEVEARRRLSDMIEVEPFDCLLSTDDLVVAVAPAKPQQVIADRFRQ